MRPHLAAAKYRRSKPMPRWIATRDKGCPPKPSRLPKCICTSCPRREASELPQYQREQHLLTYYNGIAVVQNTITSTTSIGYDTSTSGSLILSGELNGVTQPWTGDIYYAGVWGRPLSSGEMQWLHAEPYSFLTVPKQRKFFDVKVAPIIARFSYYITLERLQ
jgi:hypothetical protein